MCMKICRTVSIVVVVLGLFTLQTFATQDYDAELVLDAMSESASAWTHFNQAIEKNDYFTAAVSLMEIAQAMKSLEPVMPYKGDPDDWYEIIQEMIKTTFKAIGACGAEDAEDARAYGTQIYLLMQQGHTLFR